MLSGKHQRRALMLQLARLDELIEVFHPKALGGDPICGALCVKIEERRATLLGLNPPVSHAVVAVLDSRRRRRPAAPTACAMRSGQRRLLCFRRLQERDPRTARPAHHRVRATGRARPRSFARRCLAVSCPLEPQKHRAVTNGSRGRSIAVRVVARTAIGPRAGTAIRRFSNP